MAKRRCAACGCLFVPPRDVTAPNGPVSARAGGAGSARSSKRTRITAPIRLRHNNAGASAIVITGVSTAGGGSTTLSQVIERKWIFSTGSPAGLSMLGFVSRNPAYSIGPCGGIDRRLGRAQRYPANDAGTNTGIASIAPQPVPPCTASCSSTQPASLDHAMEQTVGWVERSDTLQRRLQAPTDPGRHLFLHPDPRRAARQRPADPACRRPAVGISANACRSPGERRGDRGLAGSSALHLAPAGGRRRLSDPLAPDQVEVLPPDPRW